jgi:hypothetical protein
MRRLQRVKSDTDYRERFFPGDDVKTCCGWRGFAAILRL